MRVSAGIASGAALRDGQHKAALLLEEHHAVGPAEEEIPDLIALLDLHPRLHHQVHAGDLSHSHRDQGGHAVFLRFDEHHPAGFAALPGQGIGFQHIQLRIRIPVDHPAHRVGVGNDISRFDRSGYRAVVPVIIVIVQVGVGQVSVVEAGSVGGAFLSQQLLHRNEAGILDHHAVFLFDGIGFKLSFPVDAPHALGEGIRGSGDHRVVIRLGDRPGFRPGELPGEEFVEGMPADRRLIPALVQVPGGILQQHVEIFLLPGVRGIQEIPPGVVVLRQPLVNRLQVFHGGIEQAPVFQGRQGLVHQPVQIQDALVALGGEGGIAFLVHDVPGHAGYGIINEIVNLLQGLDRIRFPVRVDLCRQADGFPHIQLDFRALIQHLPEGFRRQKVFLRQRFAEGAGKQQAEDCDKDQQSFFHGVSLLHEQDTRHGTGANFA